MNIHEEMIINQYTDGGLAGRIHEALQKSGKDINALTREDVFTIDEFHFQGRTATRQLAALAELHDGAEVLDIGSGLGGPARTLAMEYGCNVTGIDLVEDFCDTAQKLSDWLRMSDNVSFKKADAMELPFEKNQFDVVWLQHASMNIEDKKRLFNEVHRVLKPGGSLVLHTVTTAPGMVPYFPLPWANDTSINFLMSEDELLHTLKYAGFEKKYWRDVSEPSLAWMQTMTDNLEHQPDDGQPPLGLELVLGEQAEEKSVNLLRNLQEKRINVVQGVFKPFTGSNKGFGNMEA